ncbi:MAG: anaerobic ribonucleoside-triphosphate reductase activating protein [Thermodesulfobacteriota bacterium]|nr:anaerobic ribonucleoside-triphosphate reductase activating protein [Thermodesulfobacteriota bacterium]
MQIGGLQKTSIIDFPGKVSCVLFLAGCNFRCPYCHNPDLIQPVESPLMTVDGFFEFLSPRKGFLDGVSITGGEPCINKDIGDLCRAIKDEGLTVKLDTNGSMPDALNGLIEQGLVDYVAMDVKTEPAQYVALTRSSVDPDTVLDSIRIIRGAGIDYEFRTTCARPYVDETVIGKIADLIEGAPLYVLQKCRRERMLEPAFFNDYDEITRAELQAFQTIAGKKVGKCTVR